MWGIVSGIAFWAGVWMAVALVFGVFMGKGFAVGMGTHRRSPFPAESIGDGHADASASGDLLAQIASLTKALQPPDRVDDTSGSELRRAS
jgi:hypothetical protein